MGYTTKRSGRWQATYRGPDGRERTKTFPREIDAKKWITTNEADIARGSWVDERDGKVLFREYVTGWLETKADVAARTRINIEGRIRNHALPHFGAMQLGRIRPTDVRTFVSKLTAAGLSPATVKAIYLTTSQVFDQAVSDDVIARTPCRDVKLPREGHGEEMHFLTPEQVNDLAQSIDDRYRALVYTAAYGGLRAGELVALRTDAMKLGELGGTIAVNGAASEVRGHLTFGPTKTGRKRVVAIPRFLAQMLADHVERYPSAEGFVFTAAEGGPIRHRNFYRRHFQPGVTAAHKRATDEDREGPVPMGLRFHDLRHTCAAMLIANGRHMEEVKDHLGHSSIRVTSDRYGHLFPKARQALADGLDDTFRMATESLADISRTRSPLRLIPGEEKGAV